jgi:stearoyl-CoA desaturase (delta-9 desaturase)
MRVEPKKGRGGASPAKPSLNWRNIAFLFLSPLFAGLGIAFYVDRQGFHYSDLVCFLTMTLLTGLAITAGYHRYYSHLSYRCHPLVQVFYLLFGAAAMQAPVLIWVADHRNHHRFVDRDGDPYNIRRGFLWAHIGWTLYKNAAERDLSHIRDLLQNKLLIAQQRFHELLGILVGFGCPFMMGLAFNRPWGGVLWGGLLRVVVAHHGTFLINSAGHSFGSQPYCQRNSAKDSMLLALLSWYHWDPTKWWILGLNALGLAWELHRTPCERVRKARLCESPAATPIAAADAAAAHCRPSESL